MDIVAASRLRADLADDGHVHGLDALRFVAAMWVVISHVGFAPIGDTLDRTTPVGFLIHGGLGILCSGPAAVVIFFVISGFCIHYPYVKRSTFKIFPYLCRRYVRIGIPMVAAMAITEIAGVDSLMFFDAVLWSLVAELMYYTLYPLIRTLTTKLSINKLIIGSYAVSLMLVVAGPKLPGYAIYGWKLNWLLGLPCWLLGVKLATLWNGLRLSASEPGQVGIWHWRLFVWGLSSLCTALNFHSPFPYSLTLNVFSIIAYYWLGLELSRAKFLRRPWPVLEWAGRWSYSIYLCHIFAIQLFATFAISQNSGPFSVWAMKMAFVLIASYAFFISIEWPAHLLARRASQSKFIARISSEPSA